MRTRNALLAGIALLAAGCFGTSPPSRFFVLSASPAARASAPSTGPQGALGVFPTRVADYLDRPQVVTFVGENAVELDEYTRWAEPLGAGVTRVLSEELAALLPDWRVVPQPWDPTVPLRARVVVTVNAIGWSKSGETRLDATWAVLDAGGEQALARGRTRLRRDASSTDTAAEVAATSALVSELAREIAAGVRSAPAPR